MPHIPRVTHLGDYTERWQVGHNPQHDQFPRSLSSMNCSSKRYSVAAASPVVYAALSAWLAAGATAVISHGSLEFGASLETGVSAL